MAEMAKSLCTKFSKPLEKDTESRKKILCNAELQKINTHTQNATTNWDLSTKVKVLKDKGINKEDWFLYFHSVVLKRQLQSRPSLLSSCPSHVTSLQSQCMLQFFKSFVHCFLYDWNVIILSDYVNS